MARVITFSRNFPVGHLKAGEPTHFVEKIWKCLWNMEQSSHNPVRDHQDTYDNLFHPNGKDLINIHNEEPKIHTIRAGKRWKEGDLFSPRVWTGKPYASKQLEFAPVMPLKTVFDFKIEVSGDYICILIDGGVFYEEWSSFCSQEGALTTLAKNDGLSLEEFKAWFKWGKQSFDGQLLSWVKMENYLVEPTVFVK